MQPAPGTQIDRYVVQDRLGQGGMATVYRVRHERLGTLHALKVLHGGSPSIRARLLREGQVQGNLRHSNVLSVTDVIDVDGQPGLVMEFVDGPDLARFLAAGRLSPEEADALARPILDAVDAAHRAGLIHRDLKPANVLLAVEGDRLVPKVADFGLAKVLEETDPTAHRTRSGVAMGTPAYMAPEQVRDASRVDARADVFALGCILYELVTGRTAFEGTDSFELLKNIVDGRFADVRSLAPGLPDGMVGAIHGALHPDPDQRTPTVVALRDAWIDERPPPATRQPELVRRATGLIHVTPDATWSGGAHQTWGGTVDASAPALTLATTSESPAQALPGPRRWMPFFAALIVAGAAFSAAWWLPRAAPSDPADHVLTSTSVVQVVDDPVLQQQFADGWQAFLDADFRTAERKLEQVVAADPADPLPWFVLAQARLAREDVADGVDAIWTGVEKGRTFDSPLSRLLPHMVRVAVAEGWESEHGQAHFDYLDAHPSDYLLPLLPLYSPASTPAPEATVQRFYEAALARDPTRAAPYALHASGRIQRGLWADAIAIADDGLEKAPGSPALLARKGAAQLRAGDFEVARDTLIEATRADPGLTDARVDLAVAALVTGAEALERELAAQFTGATSPIEERAVYAMGMGTALAGLGRLDEAAGAFRELEQAAEQAGNWGLVAEFAAQQGELARLARDLDAWAATQERMRRALAAPELAPEARQRFTEITLVRDGQLAAARADLALARQHRDRLAGLPNANPRNVLAIDHAIAVAEKRPEGLHPELFQPLCGPRIELTLDRHRAGDDATAALAAAATDPTCSAVGRDPWRQRLAADALRSLGSASPPTTPAAP